MQENYYGSQLAHSNRNACIMARWSTGSSIDPSSIRPRPGKVMFYLQVEVSLKANEFESTGKIECVEHFLCKVDWFKEHRYHNVFGYPVEVWSVDTHGVHSGSYMPIFRIASHCAIGMTGVDFGENYKETVHIVVPVKNKQLTAADLDL